MAELVQVLIWVLIGVAILSVFWWALQRSGIVIPPPIVTVIVVVIAIICILFLASFLTGGPSFFHARC